MTVRVPYVIDNQTHKLADVLDALWPTKDQLARTDGLIDQIVYRLYGLTEEEIKVVEGVNG